MPDTRLELRLLGPFAVVAGDSTLLDQSFRRRKALQVLKLLALTPGHAAPRERVIDALWPDNEPDAAANNLHKNLHYLRTAFEERGLPEPVVLASGIVRLANGASVDVDAFIEAATDARRVRTDAERYERCLALYGGDLLASDAYEPWIDGRRDELRRLHRELRLELARLSELRGRWTEGIEALAPIRGACDDEAVQRALMRLYALSGDKELALREYDALAAAMRRDLDVAPSAESTRLRAEIASGRLQPETLQQPELPLVGRRDEVERLRAALEAMVDGRGGGLVLIEGEPGIGKTRLTEELAAHAHLAGARVLWGRCDRSEAVPAYWPWLQIVRQFIDERDGEEADIGGLLSAGGAGAPRASADDLRPEQGRTRLFEAIVAFLRRASRERPLLLIVDDLHDADIASLQLLRHVAREAQGSRMLVVTTFRDTEMTPSHPLAPLLGELVRERLRERVTLRGLNADEVGRFVEVTRGARPPQAVVSMLYRDTEGNPFFVKECSLLLDDASIRQAATTGHFSVPPNVRDAVARRLDALSERCRRALEVAAIVGQRFDVTTVARASDVPRAALLDAFEEAARAHVVVFAADDGPAFAHGLIRQSLYERVAPARRAHLHGRVGVAIEGAGEIERHLSELAYHFYEAARGDGDAERAIGYARRAAEGDVAVFAWHAARQHWELARELLERRGDKEALAHVLEQLPTVIFSIGDDHERGQRYLERAIALREELGQRELAAEDHSRLGVSLSTHVGTANARFTNLYRAMEHYRAAEPVLGRGPDRPSVAFFHTGMATVAFTGVHVADGLVSSARAMEVAERLGMHPVYGAALLLRGGVLKLAGRLSEAADLMAQAYEIADRANDHQISFFSATNAADWTEGFAEGRGDLLEREFNRPRNAQQTVQRTTLVSDICSALAINGRLAEARARMEAEAGQLGRADEQFSRSTLDFYECAWEKAEAALTSGLDVLRDVGNRSSLANRLDQLAALYRAQDDAGRAQAVLEEELAIGIDGGAAMIELRARADLGAVLALGGRPDDAASHVARCREIMGSGEDWGRKAGRVDVAAALAAAVSGRCGEAEHALECARVRFQRRVLPWEEADALVLLARALDLRGERAAAQHMRDNAVAIYHSIGAPEPWVDRALRASPGA